jgi:hypothetical protein
MKIYLKLSNIIQNLLIFENRIFNKHVVPKIIKEPILEYINRLKADQNGESFSEEKQPYVIDFINLLFDNFDIIGQYLDYADVELDAISKSIKIPEIKQRFIEKIICELRQQRIQPIKYIYSAEKTYTKNNIVNGAIYKVNELECCRVRKYSEYFCHIEKRGNPSNIRDTIKIAKETIWDRSNIEQITGKLFDKDLFRNSYPDTNWGSTGTAITFKEFKDRFETFININQSLNESQNNSNIVKNINDILTTGIYSYKNNLIKIVFDEIGWSAEIKTTDSPQWKYFTNGMKTVYFSKRIIELTKSLEKYIK